MKTEGYLTTNLKNKNENIYKTFETDTRTLNSFRCHSSKYFNNKQRYAPHTFRVSSSIGKKMKEITLSQHSFSKYMNTYTKLTQTYTYKSPSISYYPLRKNKKFLPITRKRNFSSNPGKLKKLKTSTSLFVAAINQNDIYKNKISKKPINMKNILNLLNTNNNYSSIFFKDEVLFKYFIEGYFLREPQILITLNLENTQINSQPIKQKDINYFNKYLLVLSKNKQYDYSNEKEFKYRLPNNRKEVNFRLIMNSLYISFTDVQTKKKYKKFLPFKYMILFYLLDYSMLKGLFSEIFYYNKEIGEFQVNEDTIDDIIHKYSLFIHNKLNDAQNLDSFDMIYKENELLYNTKYTWILNDDGEYKIYEMKIVFPKIKFVLSNINLKFVKSMSKYLLINIIKNNFLEWEKYLLYELFMTKKLRKIIDNLLFIGGAKASVSSYENKKFYLSKFENNSITKSKIKQTPEFYITQINCQSSKHFIFAPNSITINYSKKIKTNLEHPEKNKNKYEKIQLTLKESQNFYKVSKYWGVMNTIRKCMDYSNIDQKYSFNFDILDNISDDIITIIKINNPLIQNNIINKFPYKFKLDQVGFTIQDCLLSQRVLINQNKIQINYRPIPEKLSEYILSNFNKNNDNNDELNNLIGEYSSDIIREKILIDLTEEINCKGEFKILTVHYGRHKSQEVSTILIPKTSTDAAQIPNARNTAPFIKYIKPQKTFVINSSTRKKLNNENEIYKIQEKLNFEKGIHCINEEEKKKNKNKIGKKIIELKNNFKSYNKKGYKEKPFMKSLEKFAQMSTKFQKPICNKNELTKRMIMRNVNKSDMNSLVKIDISKDVQTTK